MADEKKDESLADRTEREVHAFLGLLKRSPIIAIILLAGVGFYIWHAYFSQKMQSPAVEEKECLAGFEGALDDNLMDTPEGEGQSKYTTTITVNGALVFNGSMLSQLNPGKPFGGPFENWQERDFSEKIKIKAGETAIFVFRLSDTNKLDWLAVQSIYLKCGAVTYRKKLDDRKDNLYGEKRTPVGIVNAGESKTWSFPVIDRYAE
jgi:hypothetical protein